MIRSPDMLVIGLTGGIGSGKSTVSGMLAERGATVVDTDVIAREVVEPGGAAYEAVVGRFGAGVVRPDGTLDRRALAAVVFDDPEALAGLNAIVHPAVRAEVGKRLESVPDNDPEAVVILDVPLLVESAGYGTAGVIVVDCPISLAIERLVRHRGMEAADVERRVAAQATRAQRLAQADFVIVNDASLEDLRRQVDRCWAWIRSHLPPTPHPN